MNDAHLHLLFNHLPIIIPIVGLIILIAGLILKNDTVKRTSYLIIALGAISGFAAGSTGEGAEHVLEKIPGIDENYIEAHEEAAETFVPLLYILGLIALIAFWANLKQMYFAKILSVAVLIFGGVVVYFAQKTGTTGGEIRHTEIRSSDLPPATNEGESESKYDDD